MAGRKGGGAGGGGTTNNNDNNNHNAKAKSGMAIPPGSRKIVQSLKEIVNCPEHEIYAMLMDCNMDPNEAVNRLLSQDPFHEVKSKREKKKENKETTGPRVVVSNNSMHRGDGAGADRYGIANPAGVLHGKPAFEKENGAHTYASSSTSGATGTNFNRRPTLNSDLMVAENKLSTIGACDRVALSQPWAAVPGQLSMADIVKMGRPPNKANAMPTHQNVSHLHPVAPCLATSKNDVHLSENHSVELSEVNPEPEVPVIQHVHSDDNWSSIKPSAAIMPSVLEVPPESELYTDPSKVNWDRANRCMQSRIDDIQPTEDYHAESLNENHVKHAFVSSGIMQEDGTVVSSMFDGNLPGKMASHQWHSPAFENETQDGVSSVVANLQKLSLQGDDQAASLEKNNPPVIIPNHLQVHSEDCSHLSFGSFGSGISSQFSRQLKTNVEETSEVVDDGSSAVHSDARNTEYNGDDNLRNAGDENLMHRAVIDSGNYDLLMVPHLAVLKEETPETANRDRYAFSSARGHTYENSQQLAATFDNLQASSEMQNVTPFNNVMQSYTSSLSNAFSASTFQQGREPHLSYSPFPVTQSRPMKYINAASSISGPNISIPEAVRAPRLSTPLQIPHTLPGVTVDTGLALQQHLAAHSYSQPTLSLGPFANIDYPFMPHGYSYMPSAAGNNTYQSLAAMLTQYKNSVPLSSLPQSAPVASAYGFGNSTSIPTENFSLNPPTAPGGTARYDDVSSSRNNLVLRQNDNSAIWAHGPGLRTISADPSSTNYSLQRQSRQLAGFRQGQQLSQHFGSPGYSNYFRSQTGIQLEHQQQNSRDTSVGGSHGQPSRQQQTQQSWQHSY